MYRLIVLVIPLFMIVFGMFIDKSDHCDGFSGVVLESCTMFKYHISYSNIFGGLGLFGFMLFMFIYDYNKQENRKYIKPRSAI